MNIGQQLAAKVREIAAAEPSAYVNGCLYVVDGRPLCLIGRALWDLGLIDASIETESNRIINGARSNGMQIRDLAQRRGWDLGTAAPWLGQVQRFQDQTLPWGDAVCKADVAMGDY